MGPVVGIRHAEVHNPHGLVYARSAGFPLSSRGREEAERVGRVLAGVGVAAVYSSPLERAVQTAEAIALPHGLVVERDDRLVEWGFWSRWQGTPWERLREHMPEVLEGYRSDPVGICPEDPLDRVGERVLQWAEEAAARADEGMVIGVSHESPLIAAYLVARGEGFSAFRSVNIPHLAAVRLLPAPPELLDPVDVLVRP